MRGKKVVTEQCEQSCVGRIEVPRARLNVGFQHPDQHRYTKRRTADLMGMFGAASVRKGNGQSWFRDSKREEGPAEVETEVPIVESIEVMLAMPRNTVEREGSADPPIFASSGLRQFSCQRPSR